MESRLTTSLATDVVGYSRLMGADEAGTLSALGCCAQAPDKLTGLEPHRQTTRLEVGLTGNTGAKRGEAVLGFVNERLIYVRPANCGCRRAEIGDGP